VYGRGGHKIDQGLSFGVGWSFSPQQIIRRALSSEIRRRYGRGAMSRPPRFLSAAGALLLLAHAAGSLEIGAVAPDFGMPTVERRSFSLAQAEKTHTAVVILFLSTICPYSNYYNDLTRDLAAEFAKGRDLRGRQLGGAPFESS
jgi:hypothetical protein